MVYLGGNGVEKSSSLKSIIETSPIFNVKILGYGQSIQDMTLKRSKY